MSKTKVRAIQFKYTADCIKDIHRFCNGLKIDTGKDRHPDAVGWLKIAPYESYGINHDEQLAVEGDWIVDFYLYFIVVRKEEFDSKFINLYGLDQTFFSTENTGYTTDSWFGNDKRFDTFVEAWTYMLKDKEGYQRGHSEPTTTKFRVVEVTYKKDLHQETTTRKFYHLD